MKQEENYINIFSHHNAMKPNVNDISKNSERRLEQNSDLIYRLGSRQSKVWIVIPFFTALWLWLFMEPLWTLDSSSKNVAVLCKVVMNISYKLCKITQY